MDLPLSNQKITSNGIKQNKLNQGRHKAFKKEELR